MGDSQLTDNLRIWRQVEKTNPEWTQKVDRGTSFKLTAIDAYRQINQATALWGPVGAGWGWEIIENTVLEKYDIYLVRIELWWNDAVAPPTAPANSHQVFATCPMYSGKTKEGEKRVDQDAPLKALTHAISKGLSYLGFGADVFYGLFDDNKYVAEMRREFAQQNGGQPPAASTQAQAAQAQQRPPQQQAQAQQQQGQGPAWLDERVGIRGRFQHFTWRMMTKGVKDVGPEHEYLSYLALNCTDERKKKIARFICEKVYGGLKPNPRPEPADEPASEVALGDLEAGMPSYDEH